MEEIRIGNKDIKRYIIAGIQGLTNEKEIKILGRGVHVKKAIDVAEIIRRQMENTDVSVSIGSEKYEDRYVSTIEIIIKWE